MSYQSGKSKAVISVTAGRGAALTLLCLCALDTVARAAGDEGAPLAEVTVFGSRLDNRSVFDSPVPIDVYTQKEIAAVSGSNELGQVLQALSPAVNMPRASSSGTSDSMRAIQFRGLAPDQVLVLVNGKRWHTNAVMDIEGLFPGTVAVDLNSIPVNAVDHIEVLRDGAGAVYGSDAVAGVINVVLKSGVAPANLQASYGQNHTQFAPTDRTINDGQNRIVTGDGALRLGETGSIRFGASYQSREPTNRAGPSDASWTSYNSTPADLALNNQVLFASGDPQLDNTALFYDLELPLSGHATVYSFATGNWRYTHGAAFFRYPGDPTNVPSIYPQGFRPISTGDSNDLGIVAGVRDTVYGWNADLSASEGYNYFNYGLKNTLNASLGPASPTRFHVATFVSEQQGVNLDATREVAGIFRSPLAITVGAEGLFEHYHTDPGDPASYAAGPYTVNGFGEVIPPGSQGDSGLRPQDAVQIHRTVGSVYTELASDVTSRLLLDLAGRYSHYSDYGSSTTGKFAARFKFTDELLLRTSISNSFRAPALAQTGIRLATLNFNDTGTALQNNAWLPPGDPLAQLLGAQPLQPEKSVNISAGLAWRSAQRTYATLDLYQIHITDRITPTGQISTAGQEQYLIEHGLTDVASVQYLTNGLDTTTRGLDAVVGQELSLWGGTLRLTGAFGRNYLHEDQEKNPQLLSGQVLVPLEYGSPTTKLILSTDWSSARWGLFVQGTRYGTVYAYSYDTSLPTINGWNVQRYNPVWSIDVEGRVQLLRNLQFAIGGTNVFDHYPDRTTPDSSYGGAFPYNYAHPLGINGAYYYAKLSATFGK